MEPNKQVIYSFNTDWLRKSHDILQQDNTEHHHHDYNLKIICLPRENLGIEFIFPHSVPLAFLLE